ncbi:hypothetical protein JW865_08555 [Candidatus Bathyarchaeota archaeon]|nr:hypothetical protein [Candidatus Bathyarchaeota archaeon]
MFQRITTYFEEGGNENTEETINATIKALKELEIKKVVVASTSGDSGVKVAESLKNFDIKVIVVGHQYGFTTPPQKFKTENLKRLKELGAEVYLGSDVLTNSIRQRERLGHSSLSIITQILSTLKLKVNIEIVLKATDAGLLSPGERCVSLAGSHSGLDTSVVFDANQTANILEIKMREIIAIPITREKANATYMQNRK